MPKEFLFRGKSIEELKKLEIREFAKYLSSRKRRSMLHQFDKIEKFLQRCKKKMSMGKQIKTQSREIVIVPSFMDWTINVYNGKEFVPVKIIPEMLGHRLGEFVLTRKEVKHSAPGIGATRSSSAEAVK